MVSVDYRLRKTITTSKGDKMNKMVYIPVFNRPPNKLIREETTEYYDKDYNLRCDVISAIYSDKNKTEKSVIRRVVWK